MQSFMRYFKHMNYLQKQGAQKTFFILVLTLFLACTPTGSYAQNAVVLPLPQMGQTSHQAPHSLGAVSDSFANLTPQSFSTTAQTAQYSAPPTYNPTPYTSTLPSVRPTARPQTPLAPGKSPNDPPILMSADNVRYDERYQLIVAEGNVEITEGERLLLADRIIYNQIKGQVRAEGRVRLLEPTGEVIFADQMVLNDELESGIVDQIRVLMSDNSRMAAVGARRRNGNRTEMAKAIYSPCALCKEDPSKAPLWQIKAEKIVHDQAKGDVDYYNAFLEVFGIPIFYTPYFTHPDPTVERRSGLLTPRFGHSDNMGFMAYIPYYISISQDFDATITPIVSFSGEGGILLAEVRKHFGFGKTEITTSTGYLDSYNDDGFQSHVMAYGEFDLSDVWRTGFDIERSSSKTYTRDYDLDNKTVLESRLFLEGFKGRSYMGLQSFAYQGLTGDDRHDNTPITLPEISAEFIGKADPIGGRLAVNLDGFSIYRDEGVDSHRISLASDYKLPMLFAGQELTATAGLRGDFYAIENQTDSTGAKKSSTEDRIQPYFALDWRFPLLREGKTTQTFIEPVASLTVAPTGGNKDLIPNEDSQAFSVDDSNIMQHNRYGGLDKIEGGTHVSYGLNLGYYGSEGQASAFIGQSYRLDEDDNSFETNSGLDNQFSDIVGRINLSPTNYFDLDYNFRLDSKSFKPVRHEISNTLGGSLLSLSTTYSFADANADNSGYQTQEQISASLSSKFHENWGLRAGWTRDLTDGYDLAYNFGLSYQDECLIVDADYHRSQFEDQTIQASDSFMVRFSFKNLGDIESSL